MSAKTDIVVGYDGSETAEVAVDWAAHQAARRGVSLRIVTANPYAGMQYGVGVGVVPPVDPLKYAEEVAAEGRLRAAKVLDDTRISTVAVPCSPSGAIVRESEIASLVVVGHPARGRAREYVTGSVAFAVAAHAECDAVVIPRGDLVLPGPGRPIVVGIDGSADGERAAMRAAEEAVRWEASLEIVQAWRMSSMTGRPGSIAGAEELGKVTEYFEQHSRESVDRTAAAVREAYPALTVRTVVIEEHPVTALLDLATSCGLLVVGTRGLGGFERIVLGSVSRAVVHHAVSPVLIVRP